MKYLLLLALVGGSVQAQLPPLFPQPPIQPSFPLPSPLFTPPTPAPKAVPSPTLAEYETKIAESKNSVKDIFDFKRWEGKELKSKKNKDTINFDKLTEYEKHVFCILQADRVSIELSVLFDFWTEEADKFKDEKYKTTPKPVVEDPKQEAAQLEDVKKYQQELLILRKDFAKQYEAYVVKVFDKYKTEIPQKERELYLQQVKTYHKKEKLSD